jgi:electron transport complex protein RnfG
MKLILHMLFTLTIIGIVSGGLLSEVSEWAEPQIEAHRKAETERAIFLVQPHAKSQKKIETVDFEIYQVFDENDKPIGYALPYEGNGFQGKIRLMVGVKNDLKELVGMQVLEQTETPGLGTKVTEDPFTNQFVKLIAAPDVDWVKGTPPTNSNEIQTITGATISSKAIVNIVNGGLKRIREAREAGVEL